MSAPKTVDAGRARERILARGRETCAARQGFPQDCTPWLARDMRCPGCPQDEAEEYAELVEEPIAIATVPTTPADVPATCGDCAHVGVAYDLSIVCVHPTRTAWRWPSVSQLSAPPTDCPLRK